MAQSGRQPANYGRCPMNARPVTTCSLTALVAALFVLFSHPVSAQQLFWDWGGGDAVGASGREIVRFSERFLPGQIVVSFGDRRLYFVAQIGDAISYPIAVPRDEDRWEGVTTVTNNRVNPSWPPTPAMMAENPRLPRWVPGGHPMNPLGVRALYLGASAYRIHGTDAPWTIGTAVSKGCIRMYNQDVLDLYPRAAIGATVTVTWDRFAAGGDYASIPKSTGPRLREMRQSDLPRGF